MPEESKPLSLKELPDDSLLRVAQVLQLIPVSKSHWYAGVRSGKYPKAHKLSARVTCWAVRDIRAVVNGEVVTQ